MTRKTSHFFSHTSSGPNFLGCRLFKFFFSCRQGHMDTDTQTHKFCLPVHPLALNPPSPEGHVQDYRLTHLSASGWFAFN